MFLKGNGKYAFPDVPFLLTEELTTTLVRGRYLVEASFNDMGRQVGTVMRGIANLPILRVGNMDYILDESVLILGYKLILLGLVLVTKNPKLIHQLCF